jgi:hypothetical protein
MVKQTMINFIPLIINHKNPLKSMNTLKKFEEHRGEEFLSSVASIG